jgi:hypothetical protein
MERLAGRCIRSQHDKAFSFYPALWSTEGKDINKNKKKKIPVGELFLYNLEMRKNSDWRNRRNDP